jgi:hypothetical protein
MTCEQVEDAEKVARHLAECAPGWEADARVAVCQAIRGHLLVEESGDFFPEDTALGRRLLRDAAETLEPIALNVGTRGRSIAAAVRTILRGGDPASGAAVAELWSILSDVQNQFAALTGLAEPASSSPTEP